MRSTSREYPGAPARRRLATKVTLLVGFLVSATAILVGTFDARRRIEAHLQQLILHGRTVAVMIAGNAEYGVYTEDAASLDRVIDSTSGEVSIQQIEILSVDGRVLARKAAPTEVALPPFRALSGLMVSRAPSPLSLLLWPEELAPTVVETPILGAAAGSILSPLAPSADGEREILGYVRVGISTEGVGRKIARELQETILFALGLVAVGLLLGARITRRITGPVEELTRSTLAVAAGDLDHRIEIESDDEIGRLAAAFRYMVEQLTVSAAEVEERTLQLEQSNLHLQVEVDARVAAQRELAEEKELLAVTLQSIGDGMVALDGQGRISLANRAARQLSRPDREVRPGAAFDEVFEFEDAAGRGLSLADLQALEELEDSELGRLGVEAALREGDGTLRHLSVHVTPILTPGREEVGMILVLRDVTARRRLEQEYLRNSKLESVGHLAGGIAHDFNNLLAVILGNISLLGEELVGERCLQESLRSAERACQRASELTHRLITFSKGGLPVRRETHLGPLLREVTDLSLRGSATRCDLQLPDDLWLTEIDPGQIHQVFGNLIINAKQAMLRGGVITVQAENKVLRRARRELDVGRYVRVRVSDQGVGMTAEVLEKIFDPYFTTKDTGTGLGLASSHSIIKNHHGRIEVESHLGLGTTFTIWIPACGSDTTPGGGHRAGADQDSGPGALEESERAGARILVMDDEADIRRMAVRMLKNRGHRVDAARDGEAALEMYRDARDEGDGYDLVILDLTVPGGLGGEETIQHLREVDAGVRALVSSGYSDDPVMAHHEDHGFLAAVPKPYCMRDLCREVEKALEGGAPRP